MVITDLVITTQFLLPSEKEIRLLSADMLLKRILLRKQYNTLDLLGRLDVLRKHVE